MLGIQPTLAGEVVLTIQAGLKSATPMAFNLGALDITSTAVCRHGRSRHGCLSTTADSDADVDGAECGSCFLKRA